MQTWMAIVLSLVLSSQAMADNWVEISDVRVIKSVECNSAQSYILQLNGSLKETPFLVMVPQESQAVESTDMEPADLGQRRMREFQLHKLIEVRALKVVRDGTRIVRVQMSLLDVAAQKDLVLEVNGATGQAKIGEEEFKCQVEIDLSAPQK